jgi:hypothetical protein
LIAKVKKKFEKGGNCIMIPKKFPKRLILRITSNKMPQFNRRLFKTAQEIEHINVTHYTLFLDKKYFDWRAKTVTLFTFLNTITNSILK